MPVPKSRLGCRFGKVVAHEEKATIEFLGQRVGEAIAKVQRGLMAALPLANRANSAVPEVTGTTSRSREATKVTINSPIPRYSLATYASTSVPAEIRSSGSVASTARQMSLVTSSRRTAMSTDVSTTINGAAHSRRRESRGPRAVHHWARVSRQPGS